MQPLSAFHRAFSKNVDATGLAIFRITFSMVLWFEVLQMFYFRNLIFDPVPFLVRYEINFTAALLAWLITIPFITVGLYTRPACIINYCFSLVFFASIGTFEYHMFYLYMGMNFLLVFLPTERALSLDNLRFGFNRTLTPIRYQTSQMSYFIPLLVGVGFVYTDSVFYKVTSPIWTSGLGLWYPASLPHFAHTDLHFLLNNEVMVKFLGFVTLVFEATFLLLFFRKRCRPFFLLIGCGLHFGILVAFPIPWFAFGVIAIYALLVPTAWWRPLHELAPPKWLSRFIPPCTPPPPTLVSPKRLSGSVLAFLIVASFFQCLSTLKSPKLSPYTVTVTNHPISLKLAAVSKLFLGITPHPVFMDGHFKGYDQVIAVTYRSKDGTVHWLPIISEDGSPDYYNYGSNWCKWTFRVNSPDIERLELEAGLTRFTAFWAGKNAVSLKDAKFEVLVKKITLPNHWEEGALLRERQREWEEAGNVVWMDKVSHINLWNIDKI